MRRFVSVWDIGLLCGMGFEGDERIDGYRLIVSV